MKPVATNSLSAWGYIGLLILFSLPYVGTPALIIFAIFGQGAAKSFARAILILSLGIIALAVVLVIAGLVSLGDLGIFVDGGTELFNNIRAYIG